MKEKKFETARGFQDQSIQQSLERNYILSKIRNRFHALSFYPIETPVVEETHTLLGQDSGDTQKLIFHLLDSGDFLKKLKEDEENDFDLNHIYYEKIVASELRPFFSSRALRYDFTASLRRFLQGSSIKERLKKEQSVGLYQIGSVFRAEKPQKGRYRQFTQCDADILYTKTTNSQSRAHAITLLQMIEAILRDLSIENYQIIINHKEGLDDLVQLWNAEDRRDEFLRIIDKSEKLGESEIIRKLIVEGFKGDYRLKQNVPYMRSVLSTEKDYLLKELYELPASGRHLADRCKSSDFLVRGASYYTGFLFELKINGKGLSLLGGGGYDVDKNKGIGFSFGLERLHEEWIKQRGFRGLRTSELRELGFGNQIDNQIRYENG